MMIIFIYKSLAIYITLILPFKFIFKYYKTYIFINKINIYRAFIGIHNTCYI